MGLVRKIGSRSFAYDIFGRLLISTGVVLACFLGIRIAREAVDSQIAHQPNYLVIVSTPVFEIPPATPLPSLTPTPAATATPFPFPTVTPLPTPIPTSIPTATSFSLPAIRISIPKINLNSSIQEISPTEKILSNGQQTFTWEPLAFAVAHYDTSGNPGAGTNIVLSGHNNTLGEVFRYLDRLNPGDQVILFTAENERQYQVQDKYFVPYLGDETNGNAKLLSFIAPQSSEMITIISCWPYETNANRIVIIAVPVSGGGANGQ